VSSLWVRFAFPEDLLVVLDKLLDGDLSIDATTAALTELVDSVFSVLGSSTSIPRILSGLNERLTPLSEFCLSETGSSTVVQSVFAQLLERSLPLGYDGYLVENDALLSKVLAEAEDRWAQRLEPLAPGIRIETFLPTGTWTTTHVDIITPLFYRSRSVRETFISWLERGFTNGLGVELLVPLLHGLLDSCPPEYVVENRTWDGYFSQLLELVWKQDAVSSKAITSTALIFRFSKNRTHFASILRKRLEKSPVETISRGILFQASKLWSLVREDSEGYVGAVIDHGMQWAVRRLSNGSAVSESDTALLAELGKLCDVCIFRQLTAGTFRPSCSTNQKRKGPSGRTCHNIWDQTSPSNRRGHLPMYNFYPTLCSEGAGEWRDRMGPKADFPVSRRHRTSTCSRLCSIPSSSLSVTRLLSPPRATRSYGYFGSCFSSTHKTPANQVT